MFRHWPCEHRDLSAHSSTSAKSGQNHQPGSHSRGGSRGQDPRYVPAILQLTLAADSTSRVREARSTNAEVGSVTVETLAIGAADLAVQALIHICRGSRGRAMHPALGDILHQSHMDSLSPVPYRQPSQGSWPLVFLPWRQRSSLSMVILHLATTLWMCHARWHHLPWHWHSPCQERRGIHREAVCPGPRGLQGWGLYLRIRCR